MPMEGKTIAVVVPAYRAADSIAGTVSRIPALVDWIIIVNDASPDGLKAVVQNLPDNRIVYFEHEVNQGVGGAMVTGFTHALELKADFVAKIDADGQMDPALLRSFVLTALRYDCDYVKGNRFGHIEKLKTMPRSRRFGSIALSFLTKLASGYWNVFDPQNGYIMITRRALQRLDLARLDRSYFFENSMLINLNILRSRVGEVYHEAHYEGESSSMVLREIILSFPAKLLRGLAYRIYEKYVFRSTSPVFIFLLIGIPSFLFGSIWGAVAWHKSLVHLELASTGTVSISLLFIVVGIIFIVQALVLDVQEAGPCILVDCDDEEINHCTPPCDYCSFRIGPEIRGDRFNSGVVSYEKATPIE